MKNAILLHGLPSKEEYYNPDRPSQSNSHWFPWLQQELIRRDIKADTPDVYRSYEMNLQSWIDEAERFPITEETVLVGHSAGGGFWVRYLTEHPEVHVDAVILVAPWVNSNHEYDIDFYDFEINPAITKQANRFIMFASDDDGEEVQNSVRHLINILPGATVRWFHGYGHFTQRTLQDGTFPELLEEILAL